MRIFSHFLFLLLSTLNSSNPLENDIIGLYKDKIEEITSNKNILDDTYLTDFICEKFDKDMIFYEYDRLKSIYKDANITYLCINLESYIYDVTMLNFIIELIERILKLKRDISHNIIKSIKISCITDILNKDFKKKFNKYYKQLINVQRHENNNQNNDNTKRNNISQGKYICIFVNYCTGKEFKQSLYNYYLCFLRNLKYPISTMYLKYIIYDKDKEKGKQFFNYTEYSRFFQNFLDNIIKGYGNRNNYNLLTNYNPAFQYIIISQDYVALSEENKYTIIYLNKFIFIDNSYKKCETIAHGLTFIYSINICLNSPIYGGYLDTLIAFIQNDTNNSYKTNVLEISIIRNGYCTYQKKYF